MIPRDRPPWPTPQPDDDFWRIAPPPMPDADVEPDFPAPPEDDPSLRVAEALAARRRGWVLTRLNGKKPVELGWQNKPAPSEADVKAWAAAGNVGVRTGRVSGVVVVDEDSVKDGDLAPLWRELGIPEPFTPTVRTGSGGRHLYFAAPATPLGNSAGKLAPHVDVRGDGGQVVFVGSVHPDTGKLYRWAPGLSPDDVPLAELPAALLAKLTEKKNGARPVVATRAPAPGGSAYGRAALERELAVLASTPDGQRNVMLNRCGFNLSQLVGGGELPEDEVVSALASVAAGTGLEEKAIRATIRSALRAGLATPRSAPPKTSGRPASSRSASTPTAEPESAPAVEPGEHDSDVHDTELGLAERLRIEHGQDIRFCSPWNSWLVWDGRRWVRDREGRVVELVKGTVRNLYREAAAEADPEERKRRTRAAIRCESEKAIRGAIGLARSSVPVLPDALDNDAWLVNTTSGLVDLRDGSVRPATRKDYITKLCPAQYDPAIASPLFERFLLRIFDRDLETIFAVQRAIGYAATGTCREHVLNMFIGGGRNGKSTLTTAVLNTLGDDYATQIAPDLLFHKEGLVHPTGLADLYGKRFAVTHELDAGKRLAEGTVKSLTGGDPVKGRRMREDFWQFPPTHTFFLAANTRPVILGSDDGIWARVRLFPFRVQIPPAERDTALGEKLRSETTGILTWIVRGAREWCENGLQESKAIREATAEYRSDSDVVGEFIASCCTVSSDSKTATTDLYEAFSGWYREAIGGDPMAKRTFGRRLIDAGFRPDRTRKTRSWIGLSVTQVTQ